APRSVRRHPLRSVQGVGLADADAWAAAAGAHRMIEACDAASEEQGAGADDVGAPRLHVRQVRARLAVHGKQSARLLLVVGHADAGTVDAFALVAVESEDSR